jgi:hypothetical protein
VTKGGAVAPPLSGGSGQKKTATALVYGTSLEADPMIHNTKKKDKWRKKKKWRKNRPKLLKYPFKTHMFGTCVSSVCS